MGQNHEFVQDVSDAANHARFKEELKQLALDNYNNGGDGMVECWGDTEWDEFISGGGTKASLLEQMRNWEIYRNEIQSTAW